MNNKNIQADIDNITIKLKLLDKSTKEFQVLMDKLMYLKCKLNDNKRNK